ncbi:MAG: flagellar basal body protein FliL [Deltaproteobacteria bacterium]|nr:MAG: flagellar basal body protein FliL [Deltaproteobacteria bacterium]
MAEEDKESKKEPKSDAAEAESKGSIKKWIIIGVVVLFLGGGGFAAWHFLLAERFLGQSQTEEAEYKATETKGQEFGIIYGMEPFIVNLLDKNGKRYLKTRIELEFKSEEIKEELTRRTPQLRDAILLILTSKSFEDISKPEGKLLLKNELIARINQFLPGDGIQTLYFTEFVVQ